MEVFPMSVRTITEDTVIDNICYDDLIVTSGANVTLKGTLYGNVDVKDNSHFQLNGIMRGNLFVSFCGTVSAGSGAVCVQRAR